MKFYKYIDTLPAAPSEGSFQPGDIIAVRKGVGGVYRWETNKIASDGTAYPSSITFDEWAKLTSLNSQSQLDSRFQEQKNYTDLVVQQTVAETIPIDSTVLKRGIDIPSYITMIGKSNLYGGATGTTYTNTGLPAPNNTKTVAAGYMTPAFYNKLTDTWSFGISVPLPSTPTASTVVQGGLLATSQDAVYKYIKPVSDKIDGVVDLNESRTTLSGTDVGLLLTNNTIDSNFGNWRVLHNKPKGSSTHIRYRGTTPTTGYSTLLGIRADNSVTPIIPNPSSTSLIDVTLEIPIDVVNISACGRALTGDPFIVELISYTYNIQEQKVEGLTDTISRVNDLEALTTDVATGDTPVPSSNLVVGVVKNTGAIDVSYVNWRTFENIDVSNFQQAKYDGVTPNNLDNNCTIIGKKADGTVVVIRQDTSATRKSFTITWAVDIISITVSYRATTGDVQSLILQKIERKISPNAIVTPIKRNLGVSWQPIGTSITALSASGVNGRGYTSQIQDFFTFSQVDIRGYSGYSVAVNNSGGSNGVISNMTSQWSSHDLFSLEGGTNDFRLSVSIGTKNDYLNNTGNATFYGALRVISDRWYALNPASKHVYIANGHRDNSGYNTYTINGAGHDLLDYRDAMKWVANHEGAAFVDLTENICIGVRNIMIYTVDGLHYNTLGYGQLTYKLRDILNIIY